MNIPLYSEILSHIKAHVYPDRLALTRWKMNDGELANAHLARFNDTGWEDFTVTTPWGGYDRTVWFRTSVALPPRFTGQAVVLVVDLPEGLLYVNGKPYHGLDQNHKEVLLTKNAKAGERFSLAIQAYSGRKKKQSFFESAFIATLNSDARKLAHAFDALQQLEMALDTRSAEADRLREAGRGALKSFDAISPESKQFPAAIRRALPVLLTILRENQSSDVPGSVHLIPQSHIDVVWLWTLKETFRKCARTFSTALRLMDEYQDFTFTQSQPILYQFTKEHYPSLFEGIRRRVKQGRWLPVGAMWVEPDCNIPNGESLVRQVLYGKRFFKEQFDIDSRILWLPDTFGYSWALPQILKKSGIDYFFTTKLTWNDTNNFPHNSFWWQGIDGSKVLAHLPAVGLEGDITPASLRKSWDAFQEKNISPQTVQTFGYGDGGGGPTKRQIEASAVLGHPIGLPASHLSTMEAFFSKIEESAQSLPTWNDELYLELHRGTYTTHGWVKRENRKSEVLLYDTELLCSLAMTQVGNTYEYPQGRLENAWKVLLLNQFHDIVPGTSIQEVYADVKKDFRQLRETCARLREEALKALIRRPRTRRAARSFVVFNSLGWTRSEYVELEIRSQARAFAIVDDNGKPLPYQIVTRTNSATQILVYVEDIPAFSFKQITVTPQPGVANQHTENKFAWDVAAHRCETPLFSIAIDEQGGLKSVFDKRLGRELVPKGPAANILQTFKDSPERWEAWEIDPDYERKQFPLFTFASSRVLDKGPLRATLRLNFTSTSSSRIVQDVHLYHALPRIDFRTTVKWHEKQTMLKVAFPLDVKTEHVTNETQFGALAHPTNPTTSFDKSKFELPMQQWVDLSEGDFGVSILNDCKYGFDTKGSTIRLTLIRSPHYPHPIEPMWLHDKEVTDQGMHQFTYSLYPHAFDWRKGDTTNQARALNTPFHVLEGVLRVNAEPLVSPMQSNIVISSIKKAEDRNTVILRAYESSGIATAAQFQFDKQVTSFREIDLLETPYSSFTSIDRSIEIPFSPFEIKTFELKLRRQ